nr:hypothetical protein [Tanacetum cinerariifolium]
MSGFLWCQGSISSGKAKVAWEVVCLPKKEGGLGIHRLDQFNKALMVSHIWKLLFFKESLWVKWCVQALCVISFQLVTLLGLVLALHRRFVSAFMVRVWETIRTRDNEVPWYDLVWFSSCIPRHDVHMWLIMKKRLKTQDALSSWDVVAGLTVVCPLCETQPDSHENLFFDFPFSHQIWSRVKQNAGLSASGSSLDSIVSMLMPIAKRKSFKRCIGKLTLAAAAYFVWQERNLRLFKISKRSIREVVDCDMSSVCLKLLSCRFKKSKDVVLFLRLWELPLSILK